MSVWRGVVFRDYDAVGMDRFEVCVADGVITLNMGALPEELTAYQAMQMALLLNAASEELGDGH
jgi:hypothetical protein